MMANTPELTPELQDFPPVTLTSLLKPTNIAEGAPHTTDPATDLMAATTKIYMNIGIFEPADTNTV